MFTFFLFGPSSALRLFFLDESVPAEGVALVVIFIDFPFFLFVDSMKSGIVH